MRESQSASEGAWVEITIASGDSCAPWLVSSASMNGCVGPTTWPHSSPTSTAGERPIALPASAASAENSMPVLSATMRFPLAVILDSAESRSESTIDFDM